MINANNANQMAKQIAEKLRRLQVTSSNNFKIINPTCRTNVIIISISQERAKLLQQKFSLKEMGVDPTNSTNSLLRIITSKATQESDLESLYSQFRLIIE
ncbi:MAG: hypothetical protein WCJ58_02590 [bacterium]